jgi:hypothetical protein
VLHDMIVVENKAWETRGAPRGETYRGQVTWAQTATAH